MGLDAVEVRKIGEWLERNGVRAECPACGSAATQVPFDVVAAPVKKPSGLHIGDKMTPIVQVVCNNCGHVNFFLAEPMGLDR
ncbi:MAG TPA: hypothetical protein VND68_09150 [Chloroflexia bacterium]|nr:hypothetical protein [Chloroflexia bacterium]